MVDYIQYLVYIWMVTNTSTKNSKILLVLGGITLFFYEWLQTSAIILWSCDNDITMVSYSMISRI